MRAVLGILSLLIALAVVALIAKQQLHALGGGMLTRSGNAASEVAADPGNRDRATLAIPGGMGAPIAAEPNGQTVPQQARNIEQKVRDDAVRAMQQGMERNDRADR